MGTSSISPKTDATTVNTKTEVHDALNEKSDQSTTATRTEVNNAVGTQANKSDMAVAFGGKANASDVYTKDQVN